MTNAQSMGDYNYSARFRDIVSDIARKVVQEERPTERIGKVFSVNINEQTARVWFPGSDLANLTTVQCGATMIPAQTMDVNFSQMGEEAPGDIVRVVGKAGSLWIADFISGQPRVNMFSGQVLGNELHNMLMLNAKVAIHLKDIDLMDLPGTIDGVPVLDGDRVLVWRQSNGYDNGIWIVHSGPWERAPEAKMEDTVFAGAIIKILEGNDWGGWRFTARWRHQPGLQQIGLTSMGIRPLGAGVTVAHTFNAVGVAVNPPPNGAFVRSYSITGISVPSQATRAEISLPCRGKWSTNAACFAHMVINLNSTGEYVTDDIRTHNNGDAGQQMIHDFQCSVDVVPGDSLNVAVDISNDPGSGSSLILMQSRIGIKWIGGRG